MTLAFVGDINLGLVVGRTIRALAHGEPVAPGVRQGFPFGAVRDRLRAADLAVGNLECVVSNKGERSTDHRPFRAPLEAVEVLCDAGIDLVTVANNHSLDFGSAAFRDMLDHLERGSVQAVSAPTFGHQPDAPTIREVRGVRIGWLSFGDVRPERASELVRQARPAAHVLVVLVHWGVEGCATPAGGQRALGRALVDAGADLVVGTHAHRIQPEEWRSRGLIFYGLGNFVFDAMPHEVLRIGGYLEVDVDARGVRSRRFWRVRLNRHGAPEWLEREPVEPPAIDRIPEDPACVSVDGASPAPSTGRVTPW